MKFNQTPILLALLSALILQPSAFADTTWVSGAVSGEWTRDGNPYIVVDSTWVPEGERLTAMVGGCEFLRHIVTSIRLVATEQDRCVR